MLGAATILLVNRFLDRWPAPDEELGEFAKIARSALGELSEEKESKNAIIRCYTSMTRAVNERRGLAREAAVTPAEFAAQLENAGLPRESVQSLTRVFERVRYGGQNAGAEDIQEARHCLTAILKACETNP